ncbi:MAG TPA: hypothetical protein VF434_10190 [Promineifilum sp.]
MGSRISNVDESGMVTGHPGRGLIIINIVAALAVIIAAAVITLNGRESTVVVAPEAVAPVEAFDYEAAAELSGYRAREMARFYEANGLLTRPEVDLSIYTTAPGWEQAQLVPSVKAFDIGAAGELEARRWQAMAEFYRKHNLLTRPEVDLSGAEKALAVEQQFLTEPGWFQAGLYGSAADALIEQQFLTEPGWFQAGLYGSSSKPSVPEPFSTESYWQAAEDYEAQKAGSAPTAWEMEHGR